MKVKYFFSDKNDGNLAFHVEDNEINVIKNRKNLALKLGYNYEDLVYMNQIHSSNIIVVDENSFNIPTDKYPFGRFFGLVTCEVENGHVVFGNSIQIIVIECKA